MKEIPESLTSIKAKMNGNVKFAIDAMNKSLQDICNDEEASAKVKFKTANDYLAAYIALAKDVEKEKENKEALKQRKLKTSMLQAELADKLDEKEGGTNIPSEIIQSKFDLDNIYS